MRRVAAAIVLFSALVCVRASEPWYPIKPFQDPKIYESGDWVLRIYYVHKGTSREGMNGDLLVRGKRLRPVFPPGFIQTPFGHLTFFPSPKSLDRPNVVIGWTFRDFDKAPWTTPKHPVWPTRSDWRLEEFHFIE